MDIDYKPKFDQEVYKKAILPPLIWWAIVQFTWLIFSFLDASQNTNGDSTVEVLAWNGYAVELLILFGAWVGLATIKNGANAADGFISGIILGFGAWLIWWIFFGLLNGADNTDFARDHLSKLWIFMFYHAAGAGTFAGIAENLTSSRY